MNIHIQKKEYNKILESTHVKLEMGSPLYSLQDKNSDQDILVLHQPFINQVINPFINHHQFQYKDIETNIDYNICNYLTFVKNLVSGDSIVNFELLWCPKFNTEDNKVAFLENYKYDFITFNIINAFLGIAKRDIKHFNKRPSLHDKKRGYIHISRTILQATQLIDTRDFQLVNPSICLLKKKIESIDQKEMKELEKEFSIILVNIENLKTKLQLLLTKKQISKFLSPFKQEDIVYNLNEVIIPNDYLNLYSIYETNETSIIQYNK